MIKNSYIILCMALLAACSKEPSKQFQLIPQEVSHIDFRNDLKSTHDFNVYRYRNFYNGGGVAIGDINNDGLADICLLYTSPSPRDA